MSPYESIVCLTKFANFGIGPKSQRTEHTLVPLRTLPWPPVHAVNAFGHNQTPPCGRRALGVLLRRRACSIVSGSGEGLDGTEQLGYGVDLDEAHRVFKNEMKFQGFCLRRRRECKTRLFFGETPIKDSPPPPLCLNKARKKKTITQLFQLCVTQIILMILIMHPTFRDATLL